MSNVEVGESRRSENPYSWKGQVSTFTCLSCGAKVLVGPQTTSASCPRCATRMLSSGSPQSREVPDWIIPFSVTEDAALEQLVKRFENKKYLPKDFVASISRMEGVYVPYHLHDVLIDGEVFVVGNRRVRNKYSEYHASNTAGRMRFNGVPVDASSHMSDGHMESAAPFALPQMEPFSAKHLANHVALAPDKSPAETAGRAKALADCSFVIRGLQAIARSTHITSVDATRLCKAHQRVMDTLLCAMPIWLIHAAWNGNTLFFVVNGQTGECVGDLPVSSSKRRLAHAGRRALMIPILAAGLAISPNAFVNLSSLGWSFTSRLIDEADAEQLKDMENTAVVSNSLQGQVGQAGGFGAVNDKVVAKKEEWVERAAGLSDVDVREQAMTILGAKGSPSYPRGNDSASVKARVMALDARRAFSRMQKECGEEAFDASAEVAEALVASSCLGVIGMHDDSPTKRMGCWFAISDDGLRYCSGRGERIRHTTWRELATLEQPVLDPPYIGASNVPLARYTGEAHVQKLLLALYRRLHARAKELY